MKLKRSFPEQITAIVDDEVGETSGRRESERLIGMVKLSSHESLNDEMKIKNGEKIRRFSENHHFQMLII